MENDTSKLKPTSVFAFLVFIVLVVFLLAFVLPWLMSAKSTLAVVSGIVVAVGVVISLAILIANSVKFK